MGSILFDMLGKVRIEIYDSIHGSTIIDTNGWYSNNQLAWWQERGFNKGEYGFRSGANLLALSGNNLFHITKVKNKRMHTDLTYLTDTGRFAVYSSNLDLWDDEDKKNNSILLDEDNRINMFSIITEATMFKDDTKGILLDLIDIDKRLSGYSLAIDEYNSMHISEYGDNLDKHLKYLTNELTLGKAMVAGII